MNSDNERAALPPLSPFDLNVLAVRYSRPGDPERSRERVAQVVEELLELSETHLMKWDGQSLHMFLLELVRDGLAVDVTEEVSWSRKYVAAPALVNASLLPGGVAVHLLGLVGAS